MQHQRSLWKLAVFAASTLSAAAISADELQNDFQRLQGNWSLYYAEIDGSSFLPGASVRMLVRADRYITAPETPAVTLGQFELLQMTSPRQINFLTLTGPNAGQVSEGIYGVLGIIHIVCFSPPGQPRPTEFATFPGSGRILNVWLKLQ